MGHLRFFCWLTFFLQLHQCVTYSQVTFNAAARWGRDCDKDGIYAYYKPQKAERSQYCWMKTVFKDRLTPCRKEQLLCDKRRNQSALSKPLRMQAWWSQGKDTESVAGFCRCKSRNKYIFIFVYLCLLFFWWYLLRIIQIFLLHLKCHTWIWSNVYL